MVNTDPFCPLLCFLLLLSPSVFDTLLCRCAAVRSHCCIVLHSVDVLRYVHLQLMEVGVLELL
jgi:hypothetical protein